MLGCVKGANSTISLIKDFGTDETGAVTVEWVVLTAAVVVLATGVGSELLSTGEHGILGYVRNILDEAVSATGASAGGG